jgi:uncharacterized membrane protein (UPF0127 family)
VKINVSHDQKVFVEGVELADTFWSKLSGFMFRKSPHVPGFVFESTSSIHSNFMFFTLDLAFLDKESRVIKIIRGMKPWRFTWFYPKTRYVLEVPTGVLPLTLKVGDKLELIHV